MAAMEDEVECLNGTCLCCFEPLRRFSTKGSEEDESINFVEYRFSIKESWKPCGYCEECLKCLLTVKFDEYITGIEQADCGRALRRMLQDGPPVYFRDEMALPHETSDTATNESSLDTMNQNKPSVNNAVIDESVNFTELRFASTRSTEPATLANAKFGLDRIKFWIDLIEDNKARLDDSTSLDPLLEQLKTHISCNMHC
eukprot:gene9746-1949_t